MKKLPLYVALDVDNGKKAQQLAEKTAPYVEGFKIGPRLLLKTGPSLINQLKPYGKVFLDLKFFDIPSTMVSATQSAFSAGADMVTIHAGAGEPALKCLAKLSAQLNAKRPFRILAVTVLTSFERQHLPPLAKIYSLKAHVESLTHTVIKSGLNGLVCSSHEVATLRQKYPSAYILTPGIRQRVAKDARRSSDLSAKTTVPSLVRDSRGARCALRGNDTGFHGNDKMAPPDQKRVGTPQSALLAGANALVMGRPIYLAKDPAQVCSELQTELNTLHKRSRKQKELKR